MNEKQFGTMGTTKLFFKLALPSLFSMLFSSIYIMADGIFVGKFIGSDALAAVNLVMPIVMIAFALADMIAIGSSVRIAIHLGEKNEEKACRLFSASLLAILILSIVFMVLCSLFAKDIIYALIKDDLLAELAYKYARVFIVVLPLIMPLFAVDNYLRICGKAKASMGINISVSVLNIILNAILIGHFRLGIEFAALTTAISMSIGSVIALSPFVMKKLTLRFTKPKVAISEMIGVVYNGSSEFFNNIAGSLMAIATNAILLSLGGADSVASYSIVIYINGLIMPMLYGIIDSVQPAVSYNLGAKKIDRTLSLFKLSCFAGATMSAIFLIVTFIFPDFLISLFSNKADVAIIKMAKTALLLYSISHLFTWFNMICSSFLTSFNRPRESIIIMFLRAVIFPLISLIALAPFIGVNGVYVTPAVSGALTVVVVIFIWNKTIKQIKLAI